MSETELTLTWRRRHSVQAMKVLRLRLQDDRLEVFAGIKNEDL